MTRRLTAAAVVLSMTTVQTAPALAQMSPMGPGPAEMPPAYAPPPPSYIPPQPNGPPIGQGAGWNGGNGYPGNGYPGNGYPGGGYPGNGGYPGGGGQRHVRCESWNYAYTQCPMDTRGGAEFVQIIKGDCRPGNWGTRPGFVWVNNGCRAEFRSRRGGGGYYPPQQGNDGPSAGAVIGGVAIAAGLIALLAKSSQKRTVAPAAVAGSGAPPARINVDAGAVPRAAQAAFNICLREAAREIGATGGSEIRLERLNQIEQGNGGYRFRLTLTGLYPDQSQTVPMFCRATATKLIEANFG